jgi:hypothetical protein
MPRLDRGILFVAAKKIARSEAGNDEKVGEVAGDGLPLIVMPRLGRGIFFVAAREDCPLGQ